MKIPRSSIPLRGRLAPPQRRDGGMAIIVMLVFMTLLMVYVSANVHSLNALQRDLRLTEQRQIHRLNAPVPANTSPVTQPIESNATTNDVAQPR